MKTEQEQIKEIAQEICGAKDSDICQNGCSKACFVWKYAERAIFAGYRKASDVIDEFVERVKERLEEFAKRDYEDSVPYYNADCEQIDDVIEKLAAEMRNEVEK